MEIRRIGREGAEKGYGDFRRIRGAGSKYTAGT
jgi:hypothetical protein